MYEIFLQLLNERGLKTSDVSKATNIPASTFSDWKTGRSKPGLKKMQKIAEFFNVSIHYMMTGEEEKRKPYIFKLDNAALHAALDKAIEDRLNSDPEFFELLNSVDQQYHIPVLKRVAAGIPMDSQENIIGYEEIDKNMVNKGKYFGLEISGDSMQPGIQNGDIVIVRQQEEAENGQIVVAVVNGNDGCCKRLKKYENGTIALISDNALYEPMYFNTSEIDSTPIKIMGVVKELRRRF